VAVSVTSDFSELLTFLIFLKEFLKFLIISRVLPSESLISYFTGVSNL